MVFSENADLSSYSGFPQRLYFLLLWFLLMYDSVQCQQSPCCVSPYVDVATVLVSWNIRNYSLCHRRPEIKTCTTFKLFGLAFCSSASKMLVHAVSLLLPQPDDFTTTTTPYQWLSHKQPGSRKLRNLVAASAQSDVFTCYMLGCRLASLTCICFWCVVDRAS